MLLRDTCSGRGYFIDNYKLYFIYFLRQQSYVCQLDTDMVQHTVKYDFFFFFYSEST